jgi:hypothetical protein
MRPGADRPLLLQFRAGVQRAPGRLFEARRLAAPSHRLGLNESQRERVRSVMEKQGDAHCRAPGRVGLGPSSGTEAPCGEGRAA